MRVVIEAARCIDCGRISDGRYKRHGGVAYLVEEFPMEYDADELRRIGDHCCRDCGGQMQFELSAVGAHP